MASRADLAHIPGDDGWPVVGHLWPILTRNLAFVREMTDRYGLVYRAGGLGGPALTVVGPENLGRVLTDRTGAYSSRAGLGPFLDAVFPNALVSLEGEPHRLQRRIMAAAFGMSALRRYVPRVDRFIERTVADWTGERDIYDTCRTFTLDLASRVFLGLPPGPRAQQVADAFRAMVRAVTTVVRRPIPLTPMWRGVRGRALVVDLLRELVPQRRDTEGDDLLSLLCAATDEDGNRFTDDEVVDHMAFMWLAAHDTLTSSFSALCDELARAPEWQEALCAEARAVDDAEVVEAAVTGMPLAEQSFREILRLHPPVGSIARATTRDVELGGHSIPAGTQLFLNVSLTHRLDSIWTDPDRFDPSRFAPDAPSRPRHAWLPYGGGAHTCLGARYASIVARVFTRRLLVSHRIRPMREVPTDWKVLPIRRPRGGLPLRFERR